LAASDRTVLQQARQYDARALAEIYDRHAATIYAYLYRYLGDVQLAEDLTSEVFVKFLDSLDTARAPREQLQGWLYRVAHNLAMDHFRERAKKTELPLDEEIVANAESSLNRLERCHLGEQLRQAISQLTPGQQQVILLRFGQGLKLEEIGRLLGKSKGAIKLLQFRAIERLQKLLEREENRHEQQASQPVRAGSGTSSPGRNGRGPAQSSDPNCAAIVRPGGTASPGAPQPGARSPALFGPGCDTEGPQD
jgi:RNA polymerase sigma-70 factor (ECF subfamily)